MGRDLVYKPPGATSLPDERSESKKASSAEKLPARSVDKLGLPQRGRDLGGTTDENGSGGGSGSSSEDGTAGSAGSPATSGGGELPPAMARALAAALGSDAVPATPQPAHRAAYFNKDVEATAYVNQRSQSMQALRGADAALDLRRITLPPTDRPTPTAEQLHGLAERLGLYGPIALGDLLGKLTQGERGHPLTLEELQGRLRRFEQLVADRLAARQRLAQQPHLPSVTLQRAARPAAAETQEDFMAAADALVEQTAAPAAGLQRRVAKVLGVGRK